MPRNQYTGKDTVSAARRLQGLRIQTVIAECIMNNIKKSTLLGYRTEVRRLLTWMLVCAKGSFDGGIISFPDQLDVPVLNYANMVEEFITIGTSFSKELYFLFMASHGGVFHIPFTKTRSALRFAQLMVGATDLWSTSEAAKAAEKSALRLGQLQLRDGKKRGTLTCDMALELFDFVLPKNPAMERAMRIQVGAGLRISELVALRKEHIKAEGIMILDQKRERASGTTSANVSKTLKNLTHWTEGRRALKELRVLADSTVGGVETLLFPRSAFTIKQYNSMIQSAAKVLHWPDTVHFDGSHVLRHAGVGIATRALLQQHSFEDTAKILLMSTSMITHYSLSNVERASKIHIPSFLRPLAPETEGREDSEDESDADSDEESDVEAREIARASRPATVRGDSRAPVSQRVAVNPPRTSNKPTQKRRRDMEAEASAERRVEAAEREALTSARRALRHEVRARVGLGTQPI